MKKNRMMRLASGLLVAVLATTSVISGTYAKYVTQNDAGDTARVAKFGVVIQADGKLYGEDYTKGALSVSKPTNDSSATLSVEASAKAVAPGTMNDAGLSFSVNGQPEVSTKLTVKIVAENIYLNEGTYAVMVKAPSVTETSFEANKYYTKANDEYTLASSFDDSKSYYTMEDKVIVPAGTIYYPVVYKSTDLISGGIAADSLNAIAADYAKKLNEDASVEAGDPSDGAYTYTITEKEYAPNFNYSDLDVADEKITWEWAFEQGKDGEDTILGNLMAKGDSAMVGEVVKVGDKITAPVEAAGTALNDYNLNTQFSVSIKVEQVD